MAGLKSRVHVVIPDTQVKPGVPTIHLTWIGRYIRELAATPGRSVTVIHLGDHWDMSSLSQWDRGKKAMEGRRYVADIDAGNVGFANLDADIPNDCEKHFLFGNHENRIERAAESDAQIDGLVTLEHCDTQDWQRHSFLEPVWLDGICYSHYFYNPSTGRPYAGANLETRLRTVGHSFTMGHQQGLKWGRIDTIRGPNIGLVAGSCYVHEEDYLGPQTTTYWRGIIVKHEVAKGSYDPMFVSLDYLARRYEGRSLAAVKWRKH